MKAYIFEVAQVMSRLKDDELISRNDSKKKIGLAYRVSAGIVYESTQALWVDSLVDSSSVSRLMSWLKLYESKLQKNL